MPFTPLGMLPHLQPGAGRDTPRRGKINCLFLFFSKQLPKCNPVKTVQRPHRSSTELKNLLYCLEQRTETLNLSVKTRRGGTVLIGTFSTSVGLAMEEEMTPERTPHITLVSNVSSEREERAADCSCERAAFDAMQRQWQCCTEAWTVRENTSKYVTSAPLL